MVDFQTEFRLGDASVKDFGHGGDDSIPRDMKSSEYFAEQLRFEMTPRELEDFGEIKFISPRRMPLELERWTMEEYLTMATGCIMVEAVEFQAGKITDSDKVPVGKWCVYWNCTVCDDGSWVEFGGREIKDHDGFRESLSQD